MQLSPVSERALLSWLESQASPSVLSCKRNMWAKMSTEHWWSGTDRGNWSTRRKTSPTLNLTDLTLIDLGSNAGLCGEKPATDRLRHATVSFFFSFGATPPPPLGTSFTRFLDHTQRRTTVGRTPLDAWSARLRPLLTHTTLTTDRYRCPRWDSNPHSHSNRAALDPRLRLRGHWDWTTVF